MKAKLINIFNFIPIPLLACALSLLYIIILLEKSIGQNWVYYTIGTIGVILLLIYLLSTIGLIVYVIVNIIIAFKKNEYSTKYRIMCIVFSSLNFIVYIAFIWYILERGAGV